MKKDNDDLIALGNKITAHVAKVCCFGADNTGKEEEAKIEYLKFIKAMTALFLTHTDACKKFIENSSTIRFQEQWQQIRSKGSRRKYIFTNGYGIFTAGRTMFILNLAELLNHSAIVFDWINQIYPFNKEFNFQELSPVNLYTHFAVVLSNENSYTDAEKAKKDGSYDSKLQNERSFLFCYEQGYSFNKNKDFFITNTINSVRNAYNYGFGNCALMADTAFIEAINTVDDADVTYLRFTRKEGTCDVLNCIALGNWPDKNTVIIAPWLTNNKVFCWNGNIDNTFEIKGINQNYDTAQELCKVSANEKPKFRTQLQELGYLDWLNSSTRKDNLKKIEGYSEKFFEIVSSFQKPALNNFKK
jgi:hypothetical protein